MKGRRKKRGKEKMRKEKKRKKVGDLERERRKRLEGE